MVSEDKIRKDDLTKREMERKSNDEILVHNPTHEDYYVQWGGNYFTVINTNKNNGYGGGNSLLPRYIARKYIKEMKNKLINEENDVILAKAKEEYRGTRWPEETLRISLRTNNSELIKKYFKILWLGLHKRFGMDESPVAIGKPDRKPGKTAEDTILEEMESDEKMVESAPKAKEEDKKEDKAKDKFVKEISI